VNESPMSEQPSTFERRAGAAVQRPSAEDERRPDADERRSDGRSYEANVARVEEIVRRLDSGEASLADTLALVKEGKELIERCAAELEAVGGALEELRLDDLVSHLEGGAAGRRPASRAPLPESESGAAGRRPASRAPLPESESGAATVAQRARADDPK
jgi:exodeoxyribonuclease VII small subunit